MFVIVHCRWGRTQSLKNHRAGLLSFLILTLEKMATKKVIKVSGGILIFVIQLVLKCILHATSDLTLAKTRFGCISCLVKLVLGLIMVLDEI